MNLLCGDLSEGRWTQASLRRMVVVTDEMIDAALGASYGSTTLHDLGDPYFKEIRRDIVRAALEAAMKADE